MDKITLNVNGMMCEGCENRINKVISKAPGVKDVKASHKDGTVIISGNNLNRDELIACIENLDYEVVKNKE